MAFPSDDQRRVIEHRGGPLVVLAGPGSGKTKTLVERIMAILAADPDAPVTFITFTRMSRRDTARKLEERFGRAAAAGPDDEAAFPRIATLHTFAKAIVHRGADRIDLRPNFSVLVPGREDEILFEEAKTDAGSEASPEVVRRYIYTCRHADADVRSPVLSDAEAERLRARFDELLRFYNAVDLPGLVNHARRIVETNPAILGSLLLHVDEYQDLNDADQNLVYALLRSGTCEIVVVGDDDQSIYGWRLANPNGIRQLMKHEGWTAVVFRECHRLPPHILRAAQALLRLQKKAGLNKEIVQPPDDGTKIPVYQCTRMEVENRRVIRDIKRRVAESQAAGSPRAYSDFMILSPYRTGLREVADLLEAEGIPYRFRGRKVVPDDLWLFLLLLRMIRGDDNIALRQWLPRLGLSRAEIQTLRREAEGRGTALFAYAPASGNAATTAFLELLERLRVTKEHLPALLDLIKKSGVVPLTEPLLGGIQRATATCTHDGRLSVPCLIRTLYEEYGLLDPEEDAADENKVLLSTLHSAKGLEAPVVYILHLDDRFIPAPGRDPDEETRVLYVGMTRAKEHLELSFTERFNQDERRYLRQEAATPLVRGIGAHLTFVRVTAADV